MNSATSLTDQVLASIWVTTLANPLSHAAAPDVSGLLKAWSRGDLAARDQLAPVVYEEVAQIDHLELVVARVTPGGNPGGYGSVYRIKPILRRLTK